MLALARHVADFEVDVTDVQPRLKAIVDCGCGVEGCIGIARRKPYRDGSLHVKSCVCLRCVRGERGRDAHKDGHRRQSSAMRNLGLVGTTNEEREQSVFANEVKSGRQVGPAWTWWKRAEAQVRANESDYGSRRKPVRVILKPEGTRDGIVMVRESTWAELVTPALLEVYGEP